MKKLLLGLLLIALAPSFVLGQGYINRPISSGGIGDVSISGTPTQYNWAEWTNATTIKGTAVTASKPVCTDANGSPTACAGTEGVWQAAGSYQPTNATLTAIAAQTESQGAVQTYTADNTPSVVAKGTAYQVFQMNSGATAPEWTSTIGATGTRLTYGYFIDLVVTNAIQGSITGNAATATNLAADPADCAAGQVATGIAASGALSCTATPSVTTLTGNVTGNCSGTAGGLSGTPDITVGTISAGATGFSVDADGDTTAKSITVTKSSGVAGLMSVYEANSTDTSYIGFMGPASISESYSFQFSNSQPSAGQVMAFAAPTGTGDPNGNKVSAQTWVTPVLKTQTFTQCSTIKDPVEGSDYNVYITPVAIHVTAVHCLITGSTNIVGQFDIAGVSGGSPAYVDSADMTCTTTISNDTSLGGTVAASAGSVIQWRSTSASGTPTSLIACFDYTID